MPENIDKYISIEKNKLSSDGAWLWLLDIESDDFDTLHLVNNNVNITYSGTVYVRSNFEMSPYDKSQPGRLSELSISIANPGFGRLAQMEDDFNKILRMLGDYDGIVGATVTRTPVNSKFLSIDMSAKAEEFVITSCSASQESITFTLGATNLLSRQFPGTRYFGCYCRYVKYFKGAECGYAGPASTCNGTPEDCEDKSNLARFGGQPGLRSKTVRFA